MPSPIAVMEDDQTNNGGTFQTKERGMPPPLVTTKFVCQVTYPEKQVPQMHPEVQL
jgi:hypothetical protein